MRYIGDLIHPNQVSGSTFKLTVAFRPPVFKCKWDFTESLSCYYTVYQIYVEPGGGGVLLWPGILPVSSYATDYNCLYTCTTVFETELLRGEEEPPLESFTCFQTPSFRQESAWSDSFLISESTKVDENKNLIYFLIFTPHCSSSLSSPSLHLSFLLPPRSFSSSSTCLFIFTFGRHPLLPLLRRPLSSSMPWPLHRSLVRL